MVNKARAEVFGDHGELLDSLEANPHGEEKRFNGDGGNDPICAWAVKQADFGQYFKHKPDLGRVAAMLISTLRDTYGLQAELNDLHHLVQAGGGWKATQNCSNLQTAALFPIHTDDHCKLDGSQPCMVTITLCLGMYGAATGLEVGGLGIVWYIPGVAYLFPSNAYHRSVPPVESDEGGPDEKWISLKTSFFFTATRSTTTPADWESEHGNQHGNPASKRRKLGRPTIQISSNPQEWKVDGIMGVLRNRGVASYSGWSKAELFLFMHETTPEAQQTVRSLSFVLAKRGLPTKGVLPELRAQKIASDLTMLVEFQTELGDTTIETFAAGKVRLAKFRAAKAGKTRKAK